MHVAGIPLSDFADVSLDKALINIQLYLFSCKCKGLARSMGQCRYFIVLLMQNEYTCISKKFIYNYIAELMSLLS